MKKKILSIALVLAGLVGSTAIAQTPSSDNSSVQQTEQSVSKKDKKGKKDRGQRPNPFEGLNLTEKQQSELKALSEGVRAERAKIESKEKTDKKEMIEQRKKDEKEYLGKIKEILSPEQYVQFLENSFLNNRNARPFGMNQGKQGMRPGKDGKGNKDGKKAPRGDRKGDKGDKRNAPDAK